MQIDTRLLPVRGESAAEILHNDHEIIKSLLEQLTRAGTRERTEIFDRLKGVLTIHNATEESLVYPALDRLAGSKAESQQLFHQTAEADVLVFELDSLLKEGDDEAFSAKVRKFQSAVLAHIDEEERKALPRLRDDADPEKAATLASAVRDFRKSLHFDLA